MAPSMICMCVSMFFNTIYFDWHVSPGTVLSDGKPLGGVGRLTNKRINKLQDFYGNTLYQNSQGTLSLVEVQTEIIAGLHHYSNNHEYCPTRPDTWCKYQGDKNNGTNEHKAVKNPFTQAMIEVMKPIYKVSARCNALSQKLLNMLNPQNSRHWIV